MRIYEKLMRKLRDMFRKARFKRNFRGIGIGTKLHIVWYGGQVTTMEVVQDGHFVWLENRVTKAIAYSSMRLTHMFELVEAIAEDVENGTIQQYEIVGGN
ncbi:hypothetical protein P9Z84_29355 [Bacillus cereus]|uniref:hypothetical protein n=1 Tax=Bacillus thuringiensis TaxID=1428 RepID=UPI000BF85CBF|nr:hypothetical protein [Bacillus thuringiensis]MEC3196758.1 hypothetical protein [Bacillus cereus]PEV88468.1 hypothetical protein CN442_20950 [Bacillus thuringiensis]PFK90976.1 hypothetical protein COJ04_21515 [Bacillus thuringiensis]